MADVSKVASAASNAGKAAANAAEQTAKTATTAATNAASNVASNVKAPQSSAPQPSKPQSSTTTSAPQSSTSSQSKPSESSKPTSSTPQESSQSKPKSNEIVDLEDQDEEEIEEQPQQQERESLPGSLDEGMEDESGGAKAGRAVANAARLYVTFWGKGAGKKGFEAIDTATGGKIDRYAEKIGQLSDKSKALQAFNKYNDELYNSVNLASDTLNHIYSMNFAEALDTFGKTLKNAFIAAFKSLLIPTITSLATTVLALFILLMTIFMPILAANQIMTSIVAKVEEIFSTDVGANINGASFQLTEAQKALLATVPNYDSLSQGRQAVLMSSAVAIGTPYSETGKPTASGEAGIAGGVSSGGLVEWIIWNITGSDIGDVTSTTLASGGKFSPIDQGSLLPGDFGTSGDKIGVYFGDGKWVFADPDAGVVCTSTSMFTSFYRYTDIDSITISSGTSYYDGPGPSGDLRQRVIGWAEILKNMNIPYNNKVNYNTGNSLDVNANGFFKPIADIKYDRFNQNNLKGLDCCSYAGYVYFLATGGKTQYSLCGETMQKGGPHEIKNFKLIEKQNAQAGDIMVKFHSHVMVFDHFNEQGKPVVYQMTRWDLPQGWSELNPFELDQSKIFARPIIKVLVDGKDVYYNGTITHGSSGDDGYYYYTYVGPE